MRHQLTISPFLLLLLAEQTATEARLTPQCPPATPSACAFPSWDAFMAGLDTTLPHRP